MDSESELLFAISQMMSILQSSDENTSEIMRSKVISFYIQIISLVISMDLDSQPETKLISLINQTISLGNSIPDSEPESQAVSIVSQTISIISSIELDLDRKKELEPEIMSIMPQIFFYLRPDSELMSLLNKIVSLADSTYSELKLIALIQELMPLTDDTKLIVSSKSFAERDSKVMSLIIEIITLVSSTNFDFLPKLESELTSLISQTISVFNSMDLDSQPMPLRKLISFISQKYNSLIISSDPELEPDQDWDFTSLVNKTLSLEPELELISLILQIPSLLFPTDVNWETLISLCPQVHVKLEEGKFHVIEQVERRSNNMLACLPSNWESFKLRRGHDTHFLCPGCNGKNHQKYNKAPVEIKHSLHPKHSLQLALLECGGTRKCYCCDEYLKKIIYYCSACDLAIHIACVEKPPALSIDHPKLHEHTLAMFPSQASFPCNLCALTHSSFHVYICPPCDFVVHQSCISLPHVIRISCNPHRISFTPSFDRRRDWSCGVCRRKIHNDYCIKDGCSYAAHSKCATQSNVWDGIELEGEPEEDIEELESFVKISDVIIQHFSHQDHHLRLDENTDREYDENKQCQACIMPIYFGNFYSCIQCEFILHESCANLSRKIHHPIRPHLLTLVGGDCDFIVYKSAMDHQVTAECSACPWRCRTGFYYECCEKGCSFQLHVQCAIISEPINHESHMHPLFLTSKPGEERRICSVCKDLRHSSRSTNETFNCIECDFVLCFKCATLPQKVRYEHDKHILTLSYGKETSTMPYWCEVCEQEINPKERFYMCDEYCCVTLHIECMLGKELYMKLGMSRSVIFGVDKLTVLPNNHHMSRPICYFCKKRCQQKIVLRQSGIAIHNSGLIFCSELCNYEHYMS